MRMMILQSLLRTLIFLWGATTSSSMLRTSSSQSRVTTVKVATPPSPPSNNEPTSFTETRQTTTRECRQDLLYEFSVHYKHIHRVSFLFCDKMMRNIDEIVQDSNKTRTRRTMATDTDRTTTTIRLVRSLFSAGSILIKVLPIGVLLVNGQVGLEKDLKTDDYRQVIVLDLSCSNNSLQLLELASNMGLFNSSYHWLLIQDYKDTSWNRSVRNEFGFEDTNDVLLIEFLAKLNINMNTELILARKIDQDQGDYLLFDIWNPGWQFRGKLNVTEVGRFSQCNGLQMYGWFKRTTTIVRRMDMKNVPIRCMVVVTNKFHENFVKYLEHHHDTHLDSLNRFHFELLSLVRDMFNFTFHLYRTNSWGYFRNGSYDGMIGALVRREVDIGGSPIYFRIERARLIDYTARTWIARPCFIFRHPSRTSSNRNVFLQPFSNAIWILLLLVGVVKIAFLWKLRAIEVNLLNGTINVGSNEKTSWKSVQEIPKYQRNRMWRKPYYTGDIEYRRVKGMDHTGYSYRHRYGGGKTRSDEGIIDVRKEVQMKNNRHQNIHIKRVQMDEKRCGKNSSRYEHLKDILSGIFIRSFSHHKSKVTLRENCTSMTVTREITYDGFQNNSKITLNVPNDKIAPMGIENHAIQGDKNDTCFLKVIIKKLQNALREYFIRKSEDTTSVQFESPVIFFIGALCQQGTNFHTYLLSGRCVLLTTLLFAFCFNQFYSASIVGTLLMEKPKTIKTLRDLIDSPLKVAIEDIVYMHDFFTYADIEEFKKSTKENKKLRQKIFKYQKRTTDPDAIELYEKKVNIHVDGNGVFNDGKVPGGEVTSQSAGNNTRRTVENVKSNWYSPEEGLKLMKGGGYAFHVDVATAYKTIKETFTEQEICELTEIQLFPTQKMMGIVQKGSPLRKMITYGLRRTTEAGLMDRLRKVWNSPRPRCVRQIQPDDLKVGMETFASAVFVLICGLVASLAVLLLEILYNLRFQVPEQEVPSSLQAPLSSMFVTKPLSSLHSIADENVKPLDKKTNLVPPGYFDFVN